LDKIQPPFSLGITGIGSFPFNRSIYCEKLFFPALYFLFFPEDFAQDFSHGGFGERIPVVPPVN
jgi:hypothetical protein